MNEFIPTYEIIVRLLVAAVLGSVIGFERERRAWAAGLRTHMMVCLGSCLIMIVSTYGFNDVVGEKGISLDPSRVAAQVVSGIGFLGAGTIMFLRNEVVKGLTTAAGLWTVAGIGLAVGGGLYVEALITTFIAFIILIVFKQLEERYLAKNRFKYIRFLVKLNEIHLEQVEKILTTYGFSLNEVKLSTTMEAEVSEMKLTVRQQFAKEGKLLVLIEELQKMKGVNEVNFLN